MLRRAGKRIRWGHTIFRVEGDGRVEQAVIGPVDGSRPEVVNTDVVCLGYGFAPATQLSHQIACEHRYQADQRAYAPVRDECLQTTVKGIFVAGDGAGIGGKDTAYFEGRLAALGAVRALGQEVERDRISHVKRELARQRRFVDALNTLFPLPPWGSDLLTDDTVLCRCEEVTVADIRRVIDEGANTISAIRRLVRAGMGRCQGRMCGSAMAELLAERLGRPMEEIAYAAPRPPIMPVPIDGLLENDCKRFARAGTS
jgi:NADPH-dependent 2,4-dienoyl-CoA reductase/sulfur reductase-like enzyme